MQFALDVDFLDLSLSVEEMPMQEAVERAPVVLVVVVRARVGIFVEEQIFANAEALVQRFYRNVERVPRAVRFEAAVVVGVVDEQRRARREQSREVHIIRHRDEVVRLLLGIAHVVRTEDAPELTDVAGVGDGGLHPRIEGAVHDGLPAAPGEAGYGRALWVGLRQVQQHVEAAGQLQIEDGDAGVTAEIEVGEHVVLVLRAFQFPAGKPLRMKREHPLLGQISAANLLVILGLTDGADVTVHVENHGRPLGQRVGLIEQRRHPHSGIAFIAQLANGIACAGPERLSPLHARLAIDDLLGHAFEHDFREHALAQGLRVIRPAINVLGRHKRRNSARQEPLKIPRSCAPKAEYPPSVSSRAGSLR